MEDHLNRQNNLPTLDTGFQNWLDSQTNDDLRSGLGEDVGEMIGERVREELERRGATADILPFARPNGPAGIAETSANLGQNR